MTAFTSGASKSRRRPVAINSTTFVSATGSASICACRAETGSGPRADRSSPESLSRMAVVSNTGRLANAWTSVRNGRCDAVAPLGVGREELTEAMPGVISRRATARYSGGRNQVTARLTPSATISVPRKTRKRRRLLWVAAGHRKSGRTAPSAQLCHSHRNPTLPEFERGERRSGTTLTSQTACGYGSASPRPEPNLADR